MRRQYVLSVILAVVGLSAMAWASVYVEPQEADVEDVKPSWSGRVVEVSGNASDFGRSQDTVFFQLGDSTGRVDVVQFSSDLEEVSGPVEVEGEVGIYKGEMQIIADDVSLEGSLTPPR